MILIILRSRFRFFVQLLHHRPLHAAVGDLLHADAKAEALHHRVLSVGGDFGGNRSGSAFVACGTVGNYEAVTVLDSVLHRDLLDSDMLGERFCDFIEDVGDRYGRVDVVYCDNAEPILIWSLKKAARLRGITPSIRLAKKSPVNDRIRLVCRLMSQRRFFLTSDAETVSEALKCAVYESGGNSDTRLDNGTTDIDSLDALEYSIERDTMKLIG